MNRPLANYVGGRWVQGRGPGIALHDPVTGAEPVRVSGDGLDPAGAFAFARDTGGAALRALTYAQSAAPAEATPSAPSAGACAPAALCRAFDGRFHRRD